jgi:hypothetical protein
MRLQPKPNRIETNSKRSGHQSPEYTQQMSTTEADLFHKADEIAKGWYHGHLTVMRLEHQWRVGFTTPKHPDDIDAMFAGWTLEEALAKAVGSGSPAVICG